MRTRKAGPDDIPALKALYKYIHKKIKFRLKNK